MVCGSQTNMNKPEKANQFATQFSICAPIMPLLPHHCTTTIFREKGGGGGGDEAVGRGERAGISFAEAK